MESSVTKILIKKFWKRCVTIPLNSSERGMTLPFWCSLSLMTLPSEAPVLSLPPPPLKKKRTFPNRSVLSGFREKKDRFEVRVFV